MYLIQIYNAENKLLADFSVAKKSVTKCIFGEMARNKNLKKAFELDENQFVTDLGVHSITQNNGVWEGTGKEVKIWDSKTKEESILPGIRVVAIQKGYVLRINRGYLVSLGRWKAAYSQSLGSAKTFASMESLNKFLINHADTICAFCREHGWILDYEPVSARFEEMEQEKYSHFSEKKKAKAEELKKEVEERLQSFNEIITPPAIDSEVASDDKLLKEVGYRLWRLGASDTIASDFAKGFIKVSDENGMLRQITENDQDIKNALKSAVEYGVIPYHVVLNTLRFSDCRIHCINILYITKNQDEWKFERPDPKGWLSVFCVTDQDSEFGSIQLMPRDGLGKNLDTRGLIRIG